MSICTILLGFSIANLFHFLFLILHSRMFRPCFFSILYTVLVLSDISFKRFSRNLIRLHPNLLVIRRFSISSSSSFVTFPSWILYGFLLLSCRLSTPYFMYLFFHLWYVFLDIWYLAQISVIVSPAVHSFSWIKLNFLCNSILHTLPSRTRKCYLCR